MKLLRIMKNKFPIFKFKVVKNQTIDKKLNFQSIILLAFLVQFSILNGKILNQIMTKYHF